jgi:hypothetical protein
MYHTSKHGTRIVHLSFSYLSDYLGKQTRNYAANESAYVIIIYLILWKINSTCNFDKALISGMFYKVLLPYVAGGVFHGSVSVRAVNCVAHTWHHTSWSCWRNPLLHQSQPVQAQGVRGKQNTIFNKLIQINQSKSKSVFFTPEYLFAVSAWAQRGDGSGETTKEGFPFNVHWTLR